MRSAKIATDTFNGLVRLVNPGLMTVLHKSANNDRAVFAGLCSWTNVNPHFDYRSGEIIVCAAIQPFNFLNAGDTADILRAAWHKAYWYIKEMER